MLLCGDHALPFGCLCLYTVLHPSFPQQDVEEKELNWSDVVPNLEKKEKAGTKNEAPRAQEDDEDDDDHPPLVSDSSEDEGVGSGRGGRAGAGEARTDGAQCVG